MAAQRPGSGTEMLQLSVKHRMVVVATDPAPAGQPAHLKLMSQRALED